MGYHLGGVLCPFLGSFMLTVSIFGYLILLFSSCSASSFFFVFFVACCSCLLAGLFNLPDRSKTRDH